MILKKVAIYFLFWLVLLPMVAKTTNYYTKASGSILNPSTWGINTDGSGSSPASFGINDARYHFKNRSIFNLFGLGNFMVTGNNTSIVIGDGSNSINFYLPSGYTLKTDSLYLNTNASMQISGVFDCLNPAFALGSSVNYADTSALQPVLGGNYGNLYLTIGGSKKLKGNTQVRGIFSLLDKQLICDTFVLTLGESVAVPGTLNFSNTNNLSAMIVGKFRRWIPAGNVGNNQGLFPLGNGIKYLPIQLNISSLPSNGGLLSAEFLPYWPGNTGLPFIDSSYQPYVNVNRVHAMGFWRLFVESGLSGTSYTVMVSPLNLYGILWEGAIRLLKRNLFAGTWGKPGNSNVVTGSAYQPNIGRSGLINIEGDYCLASDSNINVLPIQLLSFSGKITNKQIEFHWSSASEFNTKEFVLERYENSKWIKMGQIPASGFSHQKRNYSFALPYTSTQQIVTIKLKTIDRDGQLSHAAQIELETDLIPISLLLFPNPFQDEINWSGLNQTEGADIEIRDQQGKLLFADKDFIYDPNSPKINTRDFAPGIYYFTILAKGLCHQQKLFKL